MKKVLKSGILIIILVLGICFLSGCSNNSNNTEDNQSVYSGGDSVNMESSNQDSEYLKSSEYFNSREHVKLLVSNVGFGNGRTDDEIVVLDYVYKSNELKEKYGDSFEVKEIGGNSDGQTFFFLWLYKGTGKYFVNINDDIWVVEVSKGYFGKWEVTNCRPSEEQDWIQEES